MIVVDASAVLEVLLQTSNTPAVEKRLYEAGQTLHAPHLIDIEVAQVLRRVAMAGRIDGDRGRMALSDFADLPMQRYPHELLMPRVWALRHNLTAYDAAYVALAELLDAPLLTRDGRIARATGHRARVEVV